MVGKDGSCSCTLPLYPAFREEFPDKVIISSENAAAVSSRGTYVFPVNEGASAPVSDTTGGNTYNQYVSAYELYTAQFGSSPDKVFASIDNHPYVTGGFVWSGWDYLGEPAPYYGSRSSYFGFIDLAGFRKDRFYLYQSRWRPELPMAHILPHWNWSGRTGKVTPILALLREMRLSYFSMESLLAVRKKLKMNIGSGGMMSSTNPEK